MCLIHSAERLFIHSPSDHRVSRPQYSHGFIDVTSAGENNQYWTTRRRCSHDDTISNLTYAYSCILFKNIYMLDEYVRGDCCDSCSEHGDLWGQLSPSTLTAANNPLFNFLHGKRK